MAARLSPHVLVLLGCSLLLQSSHSPAQPASEVEELTGEPSSPARDDSQPTPSGEAKQVEPPTSPAEPNGEHPKAAAETVKPKAPPATASVPPTSEPNSPELEEARLHFEAALDSYSRGRYRTAIAELEQARTLDPQGKDLVYNLALVHEKLGELEQSLGYFRQYLQMETDADEQARIAASIQRLEGALQQAEPSVRSQNPVVASMNESPKPSAERLPGLADEWVFATGGLAVVAAVAGTLLGVRALALNPGRNDATGAERSASDFRSDAHAAHRSAVAADIAFGIALTSGVAAGLLYFGRSAKVPGEHAAWSERLEPAEPSVALDVGLRF